MKVNNIRLQHADYMAVKRTGKILDAGKRLMETASRVATNNH